MASSVTDGDGPQKEESASGVSSGSSSKAGLQRNNEDEGAVEMIRRYLAEKLGFYEDKKKEVSEGKAKVLTEASVDGVIKYIQDGNCKNVITMAGAGISTSAGIPDFRSPGSGLYHNLEKYKLPDPQAIFEIGFFQRNPQPFFTLAKELYPGSFKPTTSHYFIRLLNEKGLLRRHYTQNIDTLERVAGLPAEKIVEAHGTFHTSHCLECKQEYEIEWMKEQIFSDSVPTCEKCNGVVKPDIVFFGENLPTRFFSCNEKDFSKCDLLIILGSSLAVQPFASLIDRVPKECPRLLINREKAGQRDRLMTLLGMGSGMDFDSDDNFRDVAWLGDCDEGCQMLSDKLGWGDELSTLVKEEHARIDKEKKEEASKRKIKYPSEKKRAESKNH
ncbi:NAD-dependent protein deacetylase sirtuin-2 [Zootermopsis nevadensis]|uniref:NAD-dependent protein deacetylase n=1 Tax=Zootermopsis nevadensis TaxID=136037 RepID=A0A067QQH3_ZOONE|nr:NAD-dependent protein deacetylase sirtuin-2 [Zootermopsis nevadensis]KDR06661.1 NAD-dependent deacetylase sirtuin-2 [Zootermopsis nevadensis]